MDPVSAIGGGLAGALCGSLGGMYAARRVHRQVLLDVDDALERIAYLYERLRKRTKIDGSDRDHPAATELLKTREGVLALAAQRGLLARERR